MSSTKPLIAALAAALLSVPAAQAQVAMTDPTFSAPVDNQRELLSFQRNSAGTIYSPVAIGTTTAGGDSEGWHLGPGGTPGDPGSPTNAYNDVYVTTNGFGTPDNADFDFGISVNDGDGQIFYLVEHLGNDSFTVEPLDSLGNVITGWSLGIAPVHFSDITDSSIYDYANQGNNLAGTTFSLADFTGGSGTLTGVEGLRINGGGNLDLAQVGVATIPEASAFSLLAGCLGLTWMMMRRRHA